MSGDKVSAVGEFLGTEGFSFITETLEELPEPASCTHFLFYCYHLTSQLQVRKLFCLSKNNEKFSTPYSWRKKSVQKHQCGFCHILQCGWDYAHAFSSVFIERM